MKFEVTGLLIALASMATAQWQVNQPDASLDIDGIQGTSTDPAHVTACQGSTYTLNISSIYTGAPWDIGVTNGGGLPAGAGGIITPGLQIVNLDFSTAPFWVNAFALVPNFTNLSVPLSGPMASAAAQMFVVTAAHPDGFALSALLHLNIVPPGSTTTLPGPTTDDGSVEIHLPSCYPPASFAGSMYSSFFVNANGSISFGQAVSGSIPSVSAFASGPPCLAGLWTDLDPAEAGTIQVDLVDSGFGFNYFVIFTNVSENGTQGASTSSFSLQLDASNGTASLSGYSPDPAHASATLVGLSPGNGAADPGPAGGPTSLLPFTPTMFSQLSGLCPMNNNNDMIYEMPSGGAPAGWSSLIFPTGDPTQWFIF